MKRIKKLIYIVSLVALLSACSVPSTGTNQTATLTPVGLDSATNTPNSISLTPTPAIDPKVITPANINNLIELKQLGMGTLVDSPLYSPDGLWIFLPTTVGVFMLDANSYSYQNRRLLVSKYGYHKPMSISPDGKILAVGNQLVSIDDGHELPSPKIPRTITDGNILLISKFSPDNKLFAAIYGGYGQLDVYRMSDGQLLYTLEAESVDFSSDSRLMVITANLDEKPRIELYDVQTGELLRNWAGEFAVFLPTGQLAVENRGTIRIYDLATGKAPYAFNGKHLAISPDGQFMAFLSTSRVEIRRVADGKLLGKLSEDLGWVDDITLHFAPDGQTIAVRAYKGYCCAGYTGNLSLWHTMDGALIKSIRSVGNFFFSMDSKSVAVTGEGLQIWDTSDGSIRATVDGLTNIVQGLAFLPDEETLVAFDGNENYPFFIYQVDIDQSKRMQISDLVSMYGFSINQAGKFNAFSQYLFWNWREENLFNELKSKILMDSSTPSSIAFSSDNKIVAVGSRNSGMLRLWVIQKQNLIFEQSVCSGKEVSDLAFSPDSKQIASACVDPIWDDRGEPNIQVWEVISQGQQILELSGYGYYKVAYSPDGRFIAGGGNHLRVWSAVDGKPIFEIAYGSFTSLVRKMAFSPQGDILAIVRKDGLLELWSVMDSKRLFVQPGIDCTLDCALAFSQDGKLLAVGLDSGSIQLWGIK